MKRRTLLGGLAGATLLPSTGGNLLAAVSAASGEIPRRTFGKTGEKLTVIGLASGRFQHCGSEEAAFLDVERVPPAILCDLTDGHVMIAVGIDSTTLTTTELEVPQEWAERIAHHPAKFDGIRYFSRHTNEPCIALWLRPGGPDFTTKLKFGAPVPFLDSIPAHAVAAKCGLRLSFVR